MVVEIKDLGWENNWKENPSVVSKCFKAMHNPERKTVGRCLTRTTCNREGCHYTYTTDSSD